MAIVGLLLLISCANVANLLFARAANRGKEIAVRVSIGAGRLRLIRQLLTESVLLALLGGALGLAVAIGGARLIVGLISLGPYPVAIDVGLDARVLCFTCAVSMLTGIVFGLVPALRATRVDLAPSLKEGGGGRNSTPTGSAMRRLLVASQLALSLPLLVGAGLFVRSLGKYSESGSGFNPERLILFDFNTTGSGYSDEKLQDFYQQLLGRVATTPGVHSVSMSSLGPLTGDNSERLILPRDFRPREKSDLVVRLNSVSAKYFETMQIPLLQGRPFADTDRPGAPGVAIVNETAARFYFSGGSAVGQTFRVGREGPEALIEIVGVVRDSKQQDLRDKAHRMVYVPFPQSPRAGATFEVRSEIASPAVIGALRETVRTVSADIPISTIRTVQRSGLQPGSRAVDCHAVVALDYLR